MQRAKIQSKYWYKESDGRHCYALPDDKSVRVIRLADTVLIMQNEDSRTGDSKYIGAVSLYLGAVAQSYLTSREIQTTLDLSRPLSYIHRICALSDLKAIRTDKEVSFLRPIDILSVLEGISERTEPPVKEKPPISETWKYSKRKRYFSKCTATSVTLTFKKIEKISKVKLPSYAFTSK